MDPIILGTVFIISLFLGSFYNVVGLRTLSGEGMVTGRSHCVYCNHDLSFLDMIPFFSYIFLRGRCRYCKEKVSFIYPFGEILTGVSYTLIVNKYGFTVETLMNLAFITILIVSTVTDLKAQLVPNRFTVIGLIIVLAFRLIFNLEPVQFVISGVGAFAVLYAIFFLSGGKMGGADVKIYSLIGLSRGFVNSMLSLFFASCIALVVSLIAYFFGKDIKGLRIPFIPFITLGVLVTYYIDLNIILSLL